ncbi:MFS transporter [Paenibacillus melissococcoides]|uniref:MFS transporter n=1 Tax=Paenibacillus melissococcoides TaxID=2912268 RepID=A0ABN8U7B5_9BACL|nr:MULTISPECIES: MFS transporter [Paenibacillus]MEB9892742.1 MFS transporter [Bacillus cereus]CAH8247039.1 MFS transporter [Paenibacillus melissococcoides]CAH8716561.1 MFS transporter [Paenibacillus melissococcoides]CAH8717525.1 MFS transporter [Paenibacillus melissococcoides]GIO76548.1 putative MFS-type transporter YitG [Paenibacillus dendritiformis]
MAKQRSSSLWLEYTAIATVPLVLVLGNSMLVPILPEVKRHLHLTQLQTSLIITLFSVSAGLIIPIAGYLSDRFGRKAIIIPSLIIYGAAGIVTGLGALWESYGLLIGFRAVQGLGAAGTASIAMALVGDLYKGAQESQALGLIEASNGTGKVISPILGSALALLTWTAPFFAFPVFCALSLVAVIFLIKEPERKQKPQPLKTYIRNIGQIFQQQGRWLVPAFFAGALSLFILFGILFYLSDILEEKPYNLKGIVKGLVLAIPLLGMVTTAYITGSLIKKNGVLIRWLMNIGLLLMAVSLGCTIFFYKNVYGFIALITVSSIGTGLLLPCLNTMITGAVEKAQRGMITSLYSSLRFLGVAFGPPLFSWMMDKSHRLIFIVVTVLSVIALILVFLFIKPDKKVR